ncbi:hypothetical protein [Streptomyces sp. NBC_00038]|uniref:hypothetical protein n=1 Tax=Streptomyces sp. NBC_00038 TaxID=2903615 RepID=UPI00224EE2A3|nr:hypothetical protein [Streptomyces sp. NBC_00038]MCX5561427.1 hypothetical protein [Streptomyces sp. NBC_00038]
MSDHDPTSSREPLESSRRPGVRRLPPNSRRGRIAAAALLCAVIGLSAGCSSTSATTASPSATASSPAATGSGSTGSPETGGGDSNARSGPAEGGATGTVDTVSASGFTMTTATGQKVTVDEASSTTYLNGTTSASASAVTAGASVLVLGTTDSTTITAAQVTVQPNGDGGSATASAAGVVPFQQGASSESKQVGQIPANYSEGSGTVVGGTEADKATEAALAAYPGGVVDRVVKLSDGEYEVHNIGVNWPHHVFVDQDFKVVGAE